MGRITVMHVVTVLAVMDTIASAMVESLTLAELEPAAVVGMDPPQPGAVMAFAIVARQTSDAWSGDEPVAADARTIAQARP